jgi:hypothetical protein
LCSKENFCFTHSVVPSGERLALYLPFHALSSYIHMMMTKKSCRCQGVITKKEDRAILPLTRKYNMREEAEGES